MLDKIKKMELIAEKISGKMKLTDQEKDFFSNNIGAIILHYELLHKAWKRQEEVFGKYIKTLPRDSRIF